MGGAKNSPVSKRSKPERFFEWVFRAFAWLDDFRHRRPFATKFLVWPLSLALTWALTVHFPVLSGSTTAEKTASIVAKFAVGLFVTELFLRGVVPVLRYSCQASSMRELGLHLIITDPRQFCPVLSRFVNDHPRGERIRVICISGEYLFVEPKTRAGEDTPLHEHGRRGDLDVIMPISSCENPTVRGRFDTYSEAFRRENDYDDVDSLVEEIKRGKVDLLKNTRNTLVQHNILCMWRVVLLKEFAVVQTYFPNPYGKESNQAPIFVFKKNQDYGYYATFDQMFGLIAKYGKVEDGAA